MSTETSYLTVHPTTKETLHDKPMEVSSTFWDFHEDCEKLSCTTFDPWVWDPVSEHLEPLWRVGKSLGKVEISVNNYVIYR